MCEDPVEEKWIDVIGLDGRYQISSLGRVKSVARRVKTWNAFKSIPEIILKLRLRNGYLAWKNKNVHRMVAIAFLEKPDGSDYVNHKNGNRLDNRVSNLEWCTPEQNSRHAWLTGLCDEETRRKMSLAAKKRTGKRNTFYGKKHSEESKHKMSQAKMRLSK